MGGEEKVTKAERAKMERLESEVSHLRDEIDRHMAVYRNILHEVVTLKTQRDRIDTLLNELRDV